MPKFFNTITIHLSNAELKENYNEYLELTEEMEGKPISYSAFLKAPHLHTYIDMKCLNCDFEIRSHFGEYGMDMDEERLPFSIDWCKE